MVLGLRIRIALSDTYGVLLRLMQALAPEECATGVPGLSYQRLYTPVSVGNSGVMRCYTSAHVPPVSLETVITPHNCNGAAESGR